LDLPQRREGRGGTRKKSWEVMYAIDWGLADEFGFMASGTRSFLDEAKRGVAEVAEGDAEEIGKSFFTAKGPRKTSL
jgi:hypothetical protein